MPLNIAIIPARGGSKRLPGKNIKIFAGKPLINWTIEAALASQLFDLVLVSTDSQEILDIALDAGAVVPFLRPAELAHDTATTCAVITHMVDWVERHHGEVVSVTILQPTSPLRTATHIVEAMAQYVSKSASSIISVCEVDFPIAFCNRLPANLAMNNFIRPADHQRSQDFDKQYRLNGAIYIVNRKWIGHLADIYSDNSFAYIMDREHSIDIDDEYDFKIAEILKVLATTNCVE